ncbi:putative repeat protein (TIGR01451 family) [Povalibacter uvarum]|uniref:Putative repeat protein (TIGR01451 family) n=1 Tax=Povalibacter uvarum TaxID=732238 RepID=A0A841HI78_9GAMM|nr:OmpA family protein [Povalibacter uvarum]MBB6092891.1 putative repeat protein (TIGR01451 family) [Povalibacter uvarum]
MGPTSVGRQRSIACGDNVRLKPDPQRTRNFDSFWLEPLIAAAFLFWLPQALAQTPAGTTIQNIATVTYGDAANRSSIASNAVSAVITPAASVSALSILRAGTMGSGTATQVYATQCQSSSGMQLLAPPESSSGDPIDLSQPIALIGTSSLHGGEAAFLQLADADQNRDAVAVDIAELRVSTPGGDAEILRLSETGANTGVFAGYIQTRTGTATAGNCSLEVARNTSIRSIYVDPVDARDTSNASALVDPYGLVFDSSTGAAIDGARVRLVDASSGTLATVYGDDGVSRYPAEMVTGEAVTDAGGTLYTMPAGTFRFPLIAPGTYRIEVDAPAGHAFPSALSIADLAGTPGGPYRLQDGSFGRVFTVNAGPTVAIDVPVDPAATQLFMRKSTTTTVAAVGDFVQYTLVAENTSSNAAIGSVTIVDRLPAGARYRTGSTRIGDAVGADPLISPDGRTLTFSHGRLGAGQRVEIRYVVEVTVGANGKQFVNTARASGPDGISSNDAQATIQLREELFRERAILMGRVVEGSCGASIHQQPGVAGVRVYLEDGRYSVTDADGKYHFEDVAPGSHVVQLDTVTVPSTHLTQVCSGNVRQAGSAYSQFVDVRGGALWRSDFLLQRKQPAKGEVILRFQTSVIDPATLRHTAALQATGPEISNSRAMILMPSGLAFLPGSAQVNGAPAADPSVTDGVLTFTLPSPIIAQSVLVFDTTANAATSGALTVKALARFDSPSQAGQMTAAVENIALRGDMLYESASYRFSPRFDVLDTQILASDRDQLDRIVGEWRGVSHLRLTTIGHTDSMLIAARSRVDYPDNHALSLARARAVADYLTSRLGIDPSRVAVEGRGSDEPLAAGHDAQSLALNRRVEIAIEGLRVVAAGGLSVRTASAASAPVATVGVIEGVTVPAEPKATVEVKRGDIDVEQLPSGTDWVWPVEGEIPAIPSLQIAIRHAPAQRVELSVNGAAVSSLNFDGVSTNREGTIALSRWRGVDLKDGDNRLVARVLNEQNEQVAALQRTVHYAGGAVRAELVREASTLLADGRTRPVIALRMIDAYGKPARPGTLGGWRIDEPYRSWWEVESRDDNKMVAVGTREPTFNVDADGLVRLELEPTTQAGTAVVRLRMNERQEQEIRVWLEPRARDWILVGIAEGTTAYNTISQNMQSAVDAGLEEGYANQDRIAFFAKGAIKGEYLLTLAYDSERDHDESKDRLRGTVEPDRFYTLYADATEQRFEAATAQKLFLKVERRQFAALFGDFTTSMTVTELSRYNRTFTGLKAEHAGERFGYTAFAAESEQGYVRDELLGDGTSGLYRLSRRPLIVNSDKIRLEVRDRFRSEVVVESRELTPYIDYSVDYLNGTLFFKQPVPSRDPNFNPVYVIAEYEVLSGGESQVTGGGRASVKFAGDRVEVGTTYLQEGATAGDTRLAGTDLRWRIGEATELKAELARSESDDPAGTAEATAYLTQLEHVTERVDARVYIREQEAGFGLGQQMRSEDGTRKIGADARYRVSEHMALEGETYRQEVLGTGAQRELVSAEVRREMDDYTLGVGARHVADTGLTNGDTESQQAFVNGSVDLFRDLITLRASQDVPLGSNSSVDFPSRSLVGVDYHFRASTTFFAEYEHANGENFESDMTRVGVRTRPWQRAQIQSSMSQQATEYGPRVFANFGIMQGWKLNERWDFDFGIDQSQTIRGAGLEPFNVNVPMASGTLANDFTTTFVGAMYRSEFWTFTSRIENRRSDEEDRRVLSSGFYREPLAGHAFALSANMFDSSFATGMDMLAGEVQLAWAYRPATSAWIVLDRLDLKHDSRSDLLGEFESARVINNLNSNWQIDARTQLGLQLGARYVRSTFDDERYDGLSGLYGIDARRDLTDRLDVGFHGTLLNSMDSGVSDVSMGVDVGIVIARNVWISVGYNFDGFRDDDFEASRYTAQGPYIKFRMKADQDTFKDLSLDALRSGRSE